jgi:hypothetical protein
MLQSQGFLSSLGIPYAECRSQAEVDAKAQSVVTSFRDVEAGTYTTPNLSPSSPVNPAEMDFFKIIEHAAALQAMNAAVLAGDVSMAHSDLDKANVIAVSIGLSIVACPSDISIRANAPGRLGDVARLVANNDFPVRINGVVVQLSDVATVKSALDALVAQQPAPPPPPTTAFVPVYLPGPLPGLQVGQTFPAADGTKYTYGSLPFGPPPQYVTYYYVRVV